MFFCFPKLLIKGFNRVKFQLSIIFQSKLNLSGGRAAGGGGGSGVGSF